MSGEDNPPELSTTEKQWRYYRDMYARTGKEQHLRYMKAYVHHNPGLWVYDHPDEACPVKKAEKDIDVTASIIFTLISLSGIIGILCYLIFTLIVTFIVLV